MARKKKDEGNKNTPYIRGLNNIAQKILSVTDNNYENITEIEQKNLKFQQIINRELDIANGVSHGSILDFVQSQRESNTKNNPSNPNGANGNVSPNVFTENIDQIYNYLVELYDNKYIEMADMNYICKFIPVLSQAIKTTLNQITASDDIADGIKRIIDFDTEIEPETKSEIVSTIEKIERTLKLHKKLKNTTFKEALQTGSSFIYCIPLRDLFNEYNRKKESKNVKGHKSMYTASAINFERKHLKSAKESVGEDFEADIYDQTFYEAYRVATESVGKIIDTLPKETFGVGQPYKSKSSFIDETNKEIEHFLDSFSFVEGPVITDAMESMNAYMGFSRATRPNILEKNQGKDALPIQLPDGVKDPSDVKDLLSENEITGCYVKYISSRDLVPFKIFNETVGYYRIVTKKKKNTRVTAVNGGGIFANALDMANQKKEKAMAAIVDSISNMIMKNFNHDFLCDNQEFKNVIADCIVAKGLADNEYSIQFIPSKYIFAFKINEDSDENGEGMLAQSLFPGKMLLSYLVAKLILFVNNAGDKTIITEHRGPIDLYGKNQIDRIVRQLEGQNITFGDFLSPNIMFNKFNRNANIIVPSSQNGNKLLEFEKLEGKSMDMNTEMEEKLERMSLIGSGVPDSILEYNNDLTFSRQIVSSSIKYAGDVSSFQSDFEEPMTCLYKILLLAENLSENARNAIPHLLIGLPRPKVLSNGNNNENLRTAKEVAEMIAELYYGNEVTPENTEAKRQYTLKICKDLVTFFDWDNADDIFNDINKRYHGPTKNNEGI